MTSLQTLKILCVLPVLGQPRHAKRIAMLKQTGFEAEAVAFKRDYHKGRLPDCPVELLGKISQGRYLERLLKLIMIIPILRRAIQRNDLVYVFGLDMALAAKLAGVGLPQSIILEVGDIRELQVARGLKGKIVRKLDQYVSNASQLIVATASGFVDVYYRDWLNVQTPAIVLENKLEPSNGEDFHIKVPALSEDDPFVDRPLRIGYFGLLRCDWSWRVLETLAKNRPDNIEIVVAGYPIKPADLIERAGRLANIEYRGEFKSPEDLSDLYYGVDIVWGCYPKPRPDDWNWRWARTNRFYESCFFQTPIIALAGSGDASEVKLLGIGMTVECHEIDEVVNMLSEISLADLELWKDNMLQLPRNVYELGTEEQELSQAIRNNISVVNK